MHNDSVSKNLNIMRRAMCITAFRPSNKLKLELKHMKFEFKLQLAAGAAGDGDAA